MRSSLISLLLVLLGCARHLTNPAASGPALSGTPSWFAIGGEVYCEDDRDHVLDRPLPLVAQSLWFCDSTRPLAKMPTEEVPDPPATNFLVLSENQLHPPSSINELPTVDHGARLSLSVEPDSDSALLRMTLKLSAGERGIQRVVEHRYTNVLPFLFAFYADGKAITMNPGGFMRGGAEHVVDLIGPHSDRVWTIRVRRDEIGALCPQMHAARFAITAVFCERQHEPWSADARPYPHDERIEVAPSAEGVVLVRSNVAWLPREPK